MCVKIYHTSDILIADKSISFIHDFGVRCELILKWCEEIFNLFDISRWKKINEKRKTLRGLKFSSVLNSTWDKIYIFTSFGVHSKLKHCIIYIRQAIP